jgi:hypothetical protein
LGMQITPFQRPLFGSTTHLCCSDQGWQQCQCGM